MKVLSKEIEKSVEKSTGIGHETVSAVVDSYIKEISSRINNGDTVVIRGFGSFGVKTLKPRKQHCVNRGIIIERPRAVVPAFDFSKSFMLKYKETHK